MYNIIKKGVKKMSDNHYDEIVRLCRTCKRAAEVSVTGDYLCVKRGVVKHDHVCKKYKLNKFLPRPAMRRIMDTTQFNINDFTI